MMETDQIKEDFVGNLLKEEKWIGKYERNVSYTRFYMQI